MTTAFNQPRVGRTKVGTTHVNPSQKAHRLEPTDDQHQRYQRLTAYRLGCTLAITFFAGDAACAQERMFVAESPQGGCRAAD